VDEPIWSRTFARRIARSLGYRLPGPDEEAGGLEVPPEAARLIEELTEAFRYLPPGPLRHVLDYTEFVRGRQAEEYTPGSHADCVLEKLQAVCDLAVFLNGRHGTKQPADEKDYWTEEDERDFTAYSLNLWDEREAAGGA